METLVGRLEEEAIVLLYYFNGRGTVGLGGYSKRQK